MSGGTISSFVKEHFTTIHVTVVVLLVGGDMRLDFRDSDVGSAELVKSLVHFCPDVAIKSKG